MSILQTPNILFYFKINSFKKIEGQHQITRIYLTLSFDLKFIEQIMNEILHICMLRFWKFHWVFR